AAQSAPGRRHACYTTVMRSLARAGALISDVFELCYPTTCAVCDEPTNDREHQLCPVCAIQFAELHRAPACELCAMPLAERNAPSPWCRGAGAAHLERIVRLGVFRDPLKPLIHQMKYHRRWGLAEMLADRIVAHEPAKGILHETDVIVSVP